MKNSSKSSHEWSPGAYISIGLSFYYALDREHRVNILRNQAMIWSLKYNEDILVDELAHELRIYVEHDSAVTLFALTCDPRVFDRYTVHYSNNNDSNNGNSVDEH